MGLPVPICQPRGLKGGVFGGGVGCDAEPPRAGQQEEGRADASVKYELQVILWLLAGLLGV